MKINLQGHIKTPSTKLAYPHLSDTCDHS